MPFSNMPMREVLTFLIGETPSFESQNPEGRS